MNATVDWLKVSNQSLALAAREAGFDLTVYENYSPSVQAVLKASAIKNAMENLRIDFEEQSDGRELSEIKEGVYVICLSYPYTVEYNLSCSDVVYIGRGNLNSRLKSHYEKSLFKLMMSLAGASFTFYLTEPKGHHDAYFKHIEFMLLDNFKTKIGGDRYPLLNKNAGWDQKINGVGTGWNRPLKNSGKKPIWSIKPTVHWGLSALD
jgi:hypothetical protein